jgi:alpha-glucuronidase
MILLASCGSVRLEAQAGDAAWLRYVPLDRQHAAKDRAILPGIVVKTNDSPVIDSAERELIRGMKGMLSRTLRVETKIDSARAFVLGRLDSVRERFPQLQPPEPLQEDGFWLKTVSGHGARDYVITAVNDRGVLYGVFWLLSKMARGEDVAAINEVQQPYNRVRTINQWDNLDGSIERGYGGKSIFFENGNVRANLERAGEYARLLASVGINECAVNNVNADPRILQPSFLPQLARIADVFRPWGVRLAISVGLSSPEKIGGLDTYDPLDPRVVEWWRKTVDGIYKAIPDFGGFVVKADSEGQPGPSSYGRTPADAANMLARALAPHGGTLFYRTFVYNHHLDWRNLKNDRARAAYDIFHPLDGKFDSNVVLQIKNGPIDFQVREPVSPLIAGLDSTNEAVELEITQEYTGQQRHLCFLVPMWKEVLDFDMREGGATTLVRDLVAGRVHHRPTGGLVGVANVGLSHYWLGHPLAMANLYGFGRLAWDPRLSAKTIAEEWTRLTFGNNSIVVRTVTKMQLDSWPIYESYTGPLGLGTLTDILGSHYGPGIESAERNGWGQWIRADHEGIGMDRTVATGTGYTAQYPPEIARMYENVATTPDTLLLFFHHVPYSYRLHSGRTVIQYVYDSHYEGAERASELVKEWKTLRGLIEPQTFEAVLERQEYQAGHAIVWRDAVCNWFERISGIPDAQGRVGNYPGRIEAEEMKLEGYVPVDVKPWEDASGGKAIECPAPNTECATSFQFAGAPGRYELDVEYFDQRNGISRFDVYAGKKRVAEWRADAQLPANIPNGDTSTRYRIPGLNLKPGEEIRIEGYPNEGERAALDYVEILPMH